MKKNMALVLIATAFMQIPVSAQINTTGITKKDLSYFQYQQKQTGFSDTAISAASYLKKSKQQRTIAWVMLGGGAALTIAGGGIFVNNFELFSRKHDDEASAGVIMFLCGVGSSLGSIPFFISASHNSKNAARLGMNMQHVNLPGYDVAVSKTQPALMLTVKF